MNRETKRAMARQQRAGGDQAERLVEFRREQALRQREALRDTPKQRLGAVAWLKEVWKELKKVNRPSRSTVATYTVVVLVSVSSITAIIFGLDWLFGRAVLQLFGGPS